VRGTASGHLTIAFDGGSHDSAQSISKQSFTWHFVPAEDRSEYRNIVIDLSDGTLIYSSRQLTIASGRYELLRLSIETSSKKELADQIGQFERLPSSAIFERGKALARYVNDSEKALRLWHCGETDGLCAIRLSGEKGLNQFEDEGGPSCPAGGVGATSCSLTSCCSVSCGAGYYACCHRTENCRCIPNSGT
jgi:hypothetical protein